MVEPFIVISALSSSFMAFLTSFSFCRECRENKKNKQESSEKIPLRYAEKCEMDSYFTIE